MAQNNNPIEVSQYLQPETALRWYSRLAVGALCYALGVMLFALTTLLLLVNRPYGGFLWSWDNANGVYRADNLTVERNDNLKPADFILAVENQATSPQAIYFLAQERYQQAASVCLDTPPEEPPMIQYRVKRGGEIKDVEAPVRCFRWSMLWRLAIVPLSLAALMWVLAIFLYSAGPNQEVNLAGVVAITLIASFMAGQAANIPGISTSTLTWIATFGINNLIPPFLIAAGFHLATIFPVQHPSYFLYRFRWFWYGLMPIALIGGGTIRFQLGTDWHPIVGIMDQAVGVATWLFACSALIINLIRYRRLYKITPFRQVKNQLKWIGGSVLIVLAFVQMTLLQGVPDIVPWLPINPSILLLGPLLPLIGVTFAILRYQVFPYRVQVLRLLVILTVALAAALLFSLIPLLEPEVGFVFLLIAFTLVSAKKLK